MLTPRDALAILDPPAVSAIRLPSFCPWCRRQFAGRVLVQFQDCEPTSVLETLEIGRGEYTRRHAPDGCSIPALDRLAPMPVDTAAAKMVNRQT